MGKRIVIGFLLLICHNASAFVSNYGSTTGVDTNTSTSMYGTQMRVNDYGRNRYETVDLYSDMAGGYSSGLRYDSETNKTYRYEVDSIGRVKRWNY